MTLCRLLLSPALTVAWALAAPQPAHAFAADIDEGLALLEAWQLEDAIDLGKRALAERPEDPQVWLLAGRLQYHRGAHRAALSLLDAAAEAGVDTGYVHALVRSTAAYEAHFLTLETPHFSIRYLNKDEIVAQRAKQVLESAYARIGKALGILAAERGEKIVVEIFPDARGLAGATGLTVREIATSGTIAVCKFHRLMITSPLATANGYDWADTLAHEFVHLLVTKKSHNAIPIWLHEGIAKYYESMWSGAPGRALGAFSEKLLARAVKEGKLITYAEMHPSMAKLPSQEATGLAFAEVFTTVEFMRERFGPQAVPRLLELTATGEPLERALKKTTKLGLQGMEKAWRRWVRRRRFTLVAGAKPRRIELTDGRDAGGERPLEAIDEKDIHDHSRLGELLQLRGHHAAAVVEYERAGKKAGVKYATLNYRLARAYEESGRGEDALRLVEATLVAHPEDSDLHLLAGRVQMKRGEHNLARQHFERVILRNPFNPQTHAALVKIHEKNGDVEAAALAKRFVELSSAPRSQRTFELPPPPAGDAWLSVTPTVWGPVRLVDSSGAGRILQAPFMGAPVMAGRYHIEFLDGSTVAVDLGAGDRKRLVQP